MVAAAAAGWGPAAAMVWGSVAVSWGEAASRVVVSWGPASRALASSPVLHMALCIGLFSRQRSYAIMVHMPCKTAAVQPAEIWS